MGVNVDVARARTWTRTKARVWARKARALDEVDIPFELVGEVASAGAVTEAGHVEGSSTARHDGGDCE
jgi:hypothetical protein